MSDEEGSPAPRDDVAAAEPEVNGEEQQVDAAAASEAGSAPDVKQTVEDDEEDDEEDDGIDDDDLFGDADAGFDDGLGNVEPKQRTLDDEQLDSGDDEGRMDRRYDDEEQDEDAMQEASEVVWPITIGRHKIPKPSDNELYIMKVPTFLAIEPTAFSLQKFQPPTADPHARGPAAENFDAYKVAMTTLRWRRSPSNPKELQSNARILRWSDGSLTLQFASDPTTQYTIDGKPLAPPQRNPPKPTPTSIKDSRQRDTGYSAAHDSFTYLVAPYEDAGVIKASNKVTAGLTINPSGSTTDEALERLQNRLAASSSRAPGGANGIQIIDTMEDPEAKRRLAEKAEKQRLKEERQREKAQLRAMERESRGGRGARGMGGGGGLGLSSLESTGGKRSGTKPRRQRRDDWSDEEDYGRGRTRQDEYDEEDDFIAASDEEEEPAADDDEEEEDEEELEEPRHRHQHRESPKRGRGSDEDAVGEDDEEREEEEEEVVASTSRAAKRRRVIDEDEDEE